jgi:fatty acid desaturase
VAFKKKNWRLVSQVLIILALVAVVAAAWGFLFSDIWLASTQWLLIAVVLIAFGLYARMEK